MAEPHFNIFEFYSLYTYIEHCNTGNREGKKEKSALQCCDTLFVMCLSFPSLQIAKARRKGKIHYPNIEGIMTYIFKAEVIIVNQ